MPPFWRSLYWLSKRQSLFGQRQVSGELLYTISMRPLTQIFLWKKCLSQVYDYLFSNLLKYKMLNLYHKTLYNKRKSNIIGTKHSSRYQEKAKGCCRLLQNRECNLKASAPLWFLHPAHVKPLIVSGLCKSFFALDLTKHWYSFPTFECTRNREIKQLHNIGQWSWHSWYSGRFRHQRSAVRIQSSAKNYNEDWLLSTVLKIRK